MQPADKNRAWVAQIVSETPALDIHTHLYSPRFGGLLLWGIDELLTYHYLVAEVFRVAPLPYEKFWSMGQQQQADHIWRHLFVERTPLSEACRGVITVLNALGLDPNARELREARAYFAKLTPTEYVNNVLRLANVKSVIMTNDPFDDSERPAWSQPAEDDARFQTALRVDPLLNDWARASARLNEWGFTVGAKPGEADLRSVRRFLTDWVARIRPRYMAVSLPPDFAWPDPAVRGTLIRECIVPVTREAGIPFALMIGVRRSVNPNLRLAGDAVGRADVSAVERLCTDFPDSKFLVTMLSRENQHELCVAARKLPNLLVFGCWWFLNNPSIIEEMTRQRLELLGLSFVPQHSDCRVLDQLIYKWEHSRQVIAGVLADKYEDLARSGRKIVEADIRRDVAGLLGGIFEDFCSR